jgi:hypothetical protein
MLSGKYDVLLNITSDDPLYNILRKGYSSCVITSKNNKELLVVPCEEVNLEHHFLAELSVSDKENPQLKERVFVPYHLISSILSYRSDRNIGFQK